MSCNITTSLSDGQVTPSLDGVDQDQTHQSRKVFRKSCDRCHFSKLKCESNQRFGPCLRCQRGGVGCAYSARRAAGRPPSKDSNARQRAAATSFLKSGPLSIGKPEPHSTAGSASFDMPNLQSLTTLNEDSESLLVAGIDFSLEHTDSLISGSFEDFEAETAAATNPTLPNLSRDSHGLPPLGSPSNCPSSEQADRITTLSLLADDLEAILNHAHARCSDQNIMSYPLGGILGSLNRLDLALGFEQRDFGAYPYDHPVGELLRKKTCFLEAHCYVLAINIMAILASKMLIHVRSLRPVWDGDRHDVGVVQIYKPADADLDLRIQDHLSSIQPNLCLGDMYSHFNPYGHALHCAHTIIQASVQIIRRIENTLGIPYDWGVRGDLPTLSSDQRSPSTPDESSLSSEFVVVLWGGEEAAKGTVGTGCNAALLEFRHCQAEIAKLA